MPTRQTQFMKVPGFRKLAVRVFNRLRLLEISFVAIITHSLPFTWILYDSLLSLLLYKKQKFFPNHFLRFLRLGIGLGWFLGKLSPIVAGTTLIADGIFSIIHYRAKNITKHGIENIPRLIRIGLGIWMFTLAPFVPV